MQDKKELLELDREQWIGSKLRKEYFKAVYCNPAHLTSIQSTSCKMPDWMKASWNEDNKLGEITTSDRQMIPL